MKLLVRPAVILFGSVLVAVAGCGESRVPVSGKIHQNGKVLPIKELQGQRIGEINVNFYSVDNDAAVAHQAVVNAADGTFTVPGPNGNGIPPGKYRITVAWHDDGPLGPDRLKGAFNEKNSKIVREVNGKDEIVIDVGNAPTADEKK